MQRLVFFLLAVTYGSAAFAQSQVAAAEVGALLQRLDSTGCQFQRNGTWYSAKDAREHLQKKLDYAKSKLGSQTTEEVIDLIAAKSTVTGLAYQVRCQGGQPIESAKWLRAQLQLVRGSSEKR